MVAAACITTRIAAARIAASGLLERELTVRGDVHLHVALCRLQVEAPELLVGGQVVVDVVDPVRGVLAVLQRRHHRLRNLRAVYLGLGVEPRVAAVEQQLARRAAVHDIHLGHASLVVDLRDAGVRVVLTDILLDARGRFRGDVVPVVVVGGRVGDLLDQHAVGRIVEVHLRLVTVLALLHLYDVDRLHALAFELVYVVHLPRRGGVFAPVKGRLHGFGKRRERNIRLGHVPRTAVVEPGRQFGSSGGTGLGEREVGHHVALFGLPYDVRRSGVFGLQGRLGLGAHRRRLGSRKFIRRVVLIAARKGKRSRKHRQKKKIRFHTFTI